MPTVEIPIAQSDHDGHVAFSDASFPPTTHSATDSTQAAIDVERLIEGANYTIINGLLRFDTSTIPDSATITGALLRIWVLINDTVDSKKLYMEWYDAGTFGSEDYSATPIADAGETQGDISTLTLNADNDVDVFNVENINKSGMTGLRLHLDANGDPPTGDNWLGFASFDHATHPAPRLVVIYTEGPSQASFIKPLGMVG